jgi:hypothetical protein
MTRYNRVNPEFWTRAREWGDKTRVVGLYVLTTQHRSSEGLYSLPQPYIAADLRYAPAAVTAAMKALVEVEFIKYDDQAGVVFIPDALQLQAPTTPKQIQGAISRIRMVPRTPLLCDLYRVAATHANGLAAAMRDEFHELIEMALNSPESSNGRTPFESSVPHPHS